MELPLRVVLRWEYYLDMLVATHTGDPLPDFDDYYPSQKAYYEAQV